MEYLKLFENFNKYTEIEFVCYNPSQNSNTSKENQRKLYDELKMVDELLPYMQDWESNGEEQISLAVIILNNDKISELRSIVYELSKECDIEVDLENSVDGEKLDSIIRGDLENMI